MQYSTLQYILPPRFIFRHSEQAHEAVADVAKHLRMRGVSTPLLVHCLSDTGCMSFQGLSIGTEVALALLLMRGFHSARRRLLQVTRAIYHV